MSKKLHDITVTLFHSYDARGNDLAIREAEKQIKALMLELVGKDVIPEEYDDSSQLIDDHRDEHFRDIGSNQEKENLRRLIQAL